MVCLTIPDGIWTQSLCQECEWSREDLNKCVGGSQKLLLWSPGWRSARPHSKSVMGRSWNGVLPFPTSHTSLCCAPVLPAHLSPSLPPFLPSFCVSMALVSAPTFLSVKSPTIIFPVVLLPSPPGMYVRAVSSALTIAFPPLPCTFLVFISPFLCLSPAPSYRLLAYLKQECEFLQFKVLGWAFSEENQKKKYCLRENKSHCRAEWFSENCPASVTGVLFFFHAFRI